MSAIEIKDLTKVYGTGSRSETAIEGIDLEIKDGEFLSLVGPSGSGKTTLLRCIAGLETPTDGQILYQGEDITDVPANKRNLAMMFQDIALYPHMTTFENIAYPLKIDKVPKDEQREKVEEATDLLQISELLDKYPGQLSGGQQQRVGLARTIVQDPRAFLMDEPLSDLDAKLQVEVRKEVQRVTQRLGKATIYVTHNQEEAITMSDRIAVLRDGEIVQVGTRDDLYHYPRNVFVASFIGNPSMNFLDATLESLSDSTGVAIFTDNSIEFPVDRLFTDRVPSDVMVGFRAPAVSLEIVDNADDPDGGQLTGEVRLFEPIDDRATVTVDTEHGNIVAQVPASQSLDIGATVSIDIDSRSLYIFDKGTRELVATTGSRQITPPEIEEVRG